MSPDCHISPKVKKMLYVTAGVSILMSYGENPHYVKLPIFNGKLNQIYEKLRSDQMDPKSALGGPKPISKTGPPTLVFY